LSSKTLRRKEEGVTRSVAGDKRNQMRQKFAVFFSMGSKQTNKQTKKFLASYSPGNNKTIMFLFVNLFPVSNQTNNKQANKEVLCLLCHGRQINKFLVSYTVIMAKLFF